MNGGWDEQIPMAPNPTADRLQRSFMDLEKERDALRSALERLLANAEHIFDRKPVRDWDETLAEARAALHPAESFYACPTCGENVTRYGQRCERCTRNMEEDRLERESGR